MLLRINFSSFPHYYIYIFLTSGVKLHIHLLNVVVQFIVFLTLSTLICRSTDISKCFSESLGIRDNESRLYIDSEKYMLAMTSVPNFVKSFFDIKKIGYNINVIRQTACMVVNPITVNNFASLFNCTPAG